jgi:hypothetical protein
MADIDSISKDLAAHAHTTEQRFASLDSHLASLATTKGSHMSDKTPHIKNIFDSTPAAGLATGGMGAGLGAGLLGGVLGGALLGNGGLLGNKTADAAVAAGVVNGNDRVASLERLVTSRFDAEAQREIQADINATNAATLLAIAKQGGETNTQNALNAAALGVQVAKGFGDGNTQTALVGSALGVQIAKGDGDISTQVATTNAALGAAIERTATANALATAQALNNNLQAINASAAASSMQAANNVNAIAAQLAANTNLIQAQASQNKYDLATAIITEGATTRALINSLNDQELNRRLVTAQNEIIELRGDRNGRDRHRETEINVTQSVNQNQNNLQAQAQQQQQALVLANLQALVGGLVQQNQNIHQGIVNLGTMSGAAGQQQSANTRVN